MRTTLSFNPTIIDEKMLVPEHLMRRLGFPEKFVWGLVAQGRLSSRPGERFAIKDGSPVKFYTNQNIPHYIISCLHPDLWPALFRVRVWIEDKPGRFAKFLEHAAKLGVNFLIQDAHMVGHRLYVLDATCELPSFSAIVRDELIKLDTRVARLSKDNKSSWIRDVDTERIKVFKNIGTQVNFITSMLGAQLRILENQSFKRDDGYLPPSVRFFGSSPWYLSRSSQGNNPPLPEGKQPPLYTDVPNEIKAIACGKKPGKGTTERWSPEEISIAYTRCIKDQNRAIHTLMKSGAEVSKEKSTYERYVKLVPELNSVLDYEADSQSLWCDLQQHELFSRRADPIQCHALSDLSYCRVFRDINANFDKITVARDDTSPYLRLPQELQSRLSSFLIAREPVGGNDGFMATGHVNFTERSLRIRFESSYACKSHGFCIDLRYSSSARPLVGFTHSVLSVVALKGGAVHHYTNRDVSRDEGTIEGHLIVYGFIHDVVSASGHTKRLAALKQNIEEALANNFQDVELKKFEIRNLRDYGNLHSG